MLIIDYGNTLPTATVFSLFRSNISRRRNVFKVETFSSYQL